MTRMRAVLLACLVALLAVWVASTATLPFGAGTSSPVPAPAAAGDAGPLGSLDLERAALRLRTRIDEGARPTPSSRNPFRFGSAPPKGEAPRVPVPAPDAAASVSPAPVAPAITLVGVAEQSIEGTAVRTAVLSMAQTLYYVKAGERVGTAYEVVSVGTDAVEVRDLVSSSVRKLKLP